jgi:hypothetical protein
VLGEEHVRGLLGEVGVTDEDGDDVGRVGDDGDADVGEGSLE